MKKKNNSKYTKINKCETCEQTDQSVTWRFWNSKYECYPCALKSLEKWIKAAGLGALIIGISTLILTL